MAYTHPFTPRVIYIDLSSPPPHSNHFSQPSSVPYYPIAGRLSWSHAGGGRWELHCNAKGAHFYQAFCHSTLDDLADFVPSQIVQHLIPPIDYGRPIAQVPLLAVQLTRFSCGGLTVGVAMCRAVIDGTAAMRFVNSRAKLARGEVLDSMEMPFHDRTELDSRKLNTEPRFEHSKFHPSPLPAGSLGGSEGETKTFIAILKPSRYRVNKVKKKVDVFASRYKRPCSSFEVISGHVWRCVSKARYAGGGGDHPTRLSTLANCRNCLKPALPSNYAGNAAFPTVTPTCSFNDLMHKPVSYAVEKVREALEGLTDEYVRSALGYIEREKEMKVVRYNFHYPVRSVLEKGEFRGNSNLFVASWMNFSYREADFGWGKPVYFGPASLIPKAKAFVLNNADGDGVIVAIRLQALQMDAFKRLFFKDIEDDFPISKL